MLSALSTESAALLPGRWIFLAMLLPVLLPIVLPVLLWMFLWMLLWVFEMKENMVRCACLSNLKAGRSSTSKHTRCAGISGLHTPLPLSLLNAALASLRNVIVLAQA